MIDWLRYQLALWRYGLGLLVLLAAFAFVWCVLGGLLWLAIGELFDLELTPLGWLLCSAAVAPFQLPRVAETLGDIVRREPPPRQVDYLRNRWGQPPRS